jgi:glc operon protein GlcG
MPKRTTHGTLLALALLLGSATGHAQYTDHKSLTLDGAQRVMADATAEAKRSGGTAVIAIVDDGGNLMAVERLDDTFAAGANISIGKARTAALFKKPSKAFEDIIGNGRTAMVALNDFTPLQGGVPITVDDHVVGAIGVSGAASAQRDEEIALAGARALDSRSAEGAPKGQAGARVEYFPSDLVRDAFAKGAVLYDGKGANYMVHASRREKPGQGEVHTRDTDIIYVLDGTTTFVTGGTLVEGKPIAADEIRGSAIDGGESRRLGKGDVVIVPNGTPHWFKEVTEPVLYYVVKVR